MRHHLALAVDLAWVALSALGAVLIRDNFVVWEGHLNAVIAYAGIAVATSAIVFSIAGTHKRLWQYTSLPDFIRIIAAATVALLLAVFISFVASRLEGVARSVPVIQWFLLVSAMIGARVAVRTWQERKPQELLHPPQAFVENVLIVGVSHLTELFLEFVSKYASKRLDVIGILSEQRELRGRLLGFHKVLGSPEELQRVLALLEVHGVSIDRIIVTQTFEELSAPARGALLELEKSSSMKVEWLAELLGLTNPPASGPQPVEVRQATASRFSPAAEELLGGRSSYRALKRALDIFGAVVLSVFLLPLLVVVSLLVAMDVGLPIIFWQRRPGRFGRPFKLFKFCTMRPAHDAAGVRIAEEERSSIVGRLLRRIRLDELPQLYNILIGEMSLVGPRPLLPSDQPLETSVRQMVRPGLTGMAQVYGARDLSADDKNALDVWYVQHASTLLDVKILIRTPLVMLRGERVNKRAVRVAQKGIRRLAAQI